MKIHLIDSDTPLVRGTDIIPCCQRGKTEPECVLRAEFAFMDEAGREFVRFGDQMGTGICRPCMRALGNARYLYGIIPGEESLHNGDAA